MAIPFYEPNSPSHVAVDQIDGHQTSTSSASSTSPPPPPLGHHFYTTPPSQTILNISGQITEIPLIPNNQPAATGATATTASATPVDIDQVLAWKLLAITICKTLKLYHTNMTSNTAPNTAPQTFPATNGVLQIWPNGHVQANWTPK